LERDLVIDRPTVRPRSGSCAHCAARTSGGLCGAIERIRDASGSEPDLVRHSVRVLEAGESVFHQGGETGLVYQVISGWVVIHKDMPDGRRQNTQFLNAGMMFGMEPAGVGLRSQGATAMTGAVVCAMQRSAFDELRLRHPAFNEKFISVLERQYRGMIEGQTMLGQGDALEKVARLLWRMAVRITGGTDIPPHAEIKLPLTQRHMAGATGLTHIHLNRTVKRLRERGIVRLQRGSMVIENPEALAALANAEESTVAHVPHVEGKTPEIRLQA